MIDIQDNEKFNQGIPTYLLAPTNEPVSLKNYLFCFQLFTLLTLLDCDGIEDQSCFSEVSKMRRMYLKLFQRKLISAGCSYVDYLKFKLVLKRTNKFAELLVKLMQI